MNGAELFDDVVAYADLGHHRTGTAVDDATRTWFADRLADLGADVQLEPWDFDRYDASWTVTVDDGEIESVPLFYSALGPAVTDRAATATLPVVVGSLVAGLEERTAAAAADGARALVVATDVGTGLLCAPNCHPVVPAADALPVLCVAGALGPRLAGGADVAVRFDAALARGRSANVVARLGPTSGGPELLLTTPLSGWFSCAAERGTGIAVTLALAEALAADGQLVRVVGTSGHELGGLGLRHHLAARSGPDPASVVHIGANVAAAASAEGVPVVRSPDVTARVWAPDVDDRMHLAGLLDAFEATIVDDPFEPEGWIGEATQWCQLGLPLVSVAGLGPYHHTPEDLPSAATSPSLLHDAFVPMLAAARTLSSAGGRR